ncbi:alpha/beta hydrolase [Vibrio diabolicus]|uniref:alpha/beta hydrolase n=1 Tax=Vibrio diabolicus TaxID=50719 RepID=UPI00215CEBDF|nr:alpha/beta hydrolase [Vibrio diabolicus]MCR9303049.1 alpha/beta hydrolase [Vibrio diabolicus]MCR9428462.1 alpha/beta hydrolase [Vibrio diabolicus]
MKKSVITLGLLLVNISLIATSHAKDEQGSFAHIPTTISTQAKAFLQMLPDPSLAPTLPTPDKKEIWKQIQAGVEAETMPRIQPLLDRLQPTIKEGVIAKVPILDITPKGWKDNSKVLIYTHGGAYTLYSAKSSLESSVSVAHQTGLRVISIDYTLAPFSQWENTLEEVVGVFKELLKDGYTMDDIAIYGDSAGGALAAGSVLKMRDEGLGMPSAVVLWSPWADITETGDSYHTLKGDEPLYTYEAFLAPSANAYADPEDQKHPYVSPVYADFTKGFPPTLIQGGTKEIFLSNFVRLYQAIDNAGQKVKLDLYEGMPHIFQYLILDSAESKTAIGKVETFLDTHLLD